LFFQSEIIYEIFYHEYRIFGNYVKHVFFVDVFDVQIKTYRLQLE